MITMMRLWFQPFKINLKDDKVVLIGNNYDTTLSTATEIKEHGHTVMVYKKYLDLIDKEDQDAIICENKIFFKSRESNTLLIIAICMNGD